MSRDSCERCPELRHCRPDGTMGGVFSTGAPPIVVSSCRNVAAAWAWSCSRCQNIAERFRDVVAVWSHLTGLRTVLLCGVPWFLPSDGPV
jgi:hypothetical protein